MLKILLMTLVLFNSASAAEIFKCVDKHGKVNYSDHACEQNADSLVFKANIGAFKPQETTAVALHTQPQKQKAQQNTSLLQNFSYQIIMAIYALMSLLCFGCYFIDKRAAEKDLWRIPEKSLHTLELLGGWPGALLAQQTLRHKNRKLSYQVVFWLIVGLHVAGLAQLRQIT